MSISVYTIPDHAVDETRRATALENLDLARAFDDATLAGLSAQAREAAGTSMAAVTLIHGFDAYLVATAGFPGGVYRRSTSLCGHAVLAPERLFVVPDTRADERFAGNPFVAGEDGIRFYAAAQLVADRGLVIGTLCIFDHAPRVGLGDAQGRALIALADRVMARLLDLSGA